MPAINGLDAIGHGYREEVRLEVEIQIGEADNMISFYERQVEELARASSDQMTPHSIVPAR